MKTGSLIYPFTIKKIPWLEAFKTYLQTGYLLHSITLISIILSDLVYRLLVLNWHSENNLKIILLTYLFIWLLSLPVFAQLDARSRFQNYKLLRDLLYRYGFKYRFIRTMRHSRCQRDAARVAAKSLDFDYMIKKYYRRCGYRWYHILPDFIFKKPIYLFSGHFWLTTFFARTYHSKFFN